MIGARLPAGPGLSSVGVPGEYSSAAADVDAVYVARPAVLPYHAHLTMADLAGYLRGALNLLLLLLNLTFWFTLLFLVLVARIVWPFGRWRKGCSRIMARIAELWGLTTIAILDATTGIHWDIRCSADLRRDANYLLLSNHVSWVDIFAVIRTLFGKIPFPRFFAKQEIIWLPMIGVAAWGLDFPFMKRYTPEYLARHPERRGTDLEATRKACERFRGLPLSIINYSEGTRFTPEKHRRQGSPYRHLLKPRVGGVGFVMASLGDCIQSVLDITVVYPDRDPSWWKYMCGRVSRIVVVVRELPLPPFAGRDIASDTTVREAFREWMEEIWRVKDEVIDEVLAENNR